MNEPHKHAELIKAWADGAIIQSRVKGDSGQWLIWDEIHTPAWFTDDDIEYRIKPKEKQKVKMWQWVYKDHYGGYIELTQQFYESKEDASQDYRMTHTGCEEVLFKADWTEIEVEVEDE